MRDPNMDPRLDPERAQSPYADDCPCPGPLKGVCPDCPYRKCEHGCKPDAIVFGCPVHDWMTGGAPMPDSLE